MTDGLPQQWSAWAARRPEFRGSHLNSAAAGRNSWAVLQAVADHALLEAQVGACVAEEAAQPVLEAGRARLAGLLGVPADGVAFVEHASAGLAAVLSAWPLPEGAAVGVVASEWGPNLEAFAGRGLSLVELPSDGHGALDLDALPRMLGSSPPAVVHLTQLAAHRGLVQPVAAAAAVCRAAGVALWVDAAQALGHVDTACGADVLYATGRKWLCGPRGVGVLAVAQQCWDTLRVTVSAMAPAGWPTVRHLESHDAHVAGRVGLCTALDEHVADDPAAVWQRLDEVGRLTRDALADLPGWQVVAARAGSGAITALRPTAGQDVQAVCRQLLAEDRILATASLPARAPREMATPLLRIAGHVDCTPEQLVALRTALS
ncbi:MAG: aminotransferase class V-fold PLP-dependent enzyme [Pseudonocardiales bacterium]